MQSNLHRCDELFQAPVRSDRLLSSEPSVALLPTASGAGRWSLSRRPPSEVLMATSVSSYLLKRLTDWGVRRVFGYAGDGINGDHPRLQPLRGPPEVRAGPARGDGGVHGLRARQVHGRGRGVHGHLGPGRHPPAERALRRQDGPPAGGGHRWPGGAPCSRRRLPAGGGSPHALQGRGARVRAADGQPRPGPAAGRPRHPHRTLRADGDRDHRPQGPPGGEGRAATTQAQHGAHRTRLELAPRGAERERSRPRRGGAQRRPEGGDAGGRRGARGLAGGGPGRPRSSGPASPRRCSARRCSTTGSRTSPAPSGFSERSPAGP